MIDEPKKVIRTMEIQSVELTIQLDEAFYNDLMVDKKKIDEKMGEVIPLGEHIMQTINTLLKVNHELGKTCEQQDQVIKMFLSLPNITAEKIEELEEESEKLDFEKHPEGMYG